MFEDGGIEEAVPLTDVNKPTMEKIMVFTAYLRNQNPEGTIEIEQPLPSNDLSQHVSEWYYNYITQDVDQSLLFDLLIAANYLDIKPLLKLGSAKLASLIKGKTTEEIR